MFRVLCGVLCRVLPVVACTRTHARPPARTAGLGPDPPRSTSQHDPNSFTDRETDHNKGPGRCHVRHSPSPSRPQNLGPNAPFAPLTQAQVGAKCPQSGVRMPQRHQKGAESASSRRTAVGSRGGLERDEELQSLRACSWHRSGQVGVAWVGVCLLQSLAPAAEHRAWIFARVSAG